MLRFKILQAYAFCNQQFFKLYPMFGHKNHTL
jgi:hypothetical protein